VEEHLGVLEALGVVSHADVDELRVVVDLLERGGGLVEVAIHHLFAGDLGHGVDELGVEEALVARACLLGAQFELGQGLSIGKIFVDVGGVDRGAECEIQRQGKKEGSETKDEFHTHLEGAQLLHVFEGDEAVAGLPLLVRKLAVCHGEELFVQVGRLFRMVKLIVSRCFEEQRTRRIGKYCST